MLQNFEHPSDSAFSMTPKLSSAQRLQWGNTGLYLYRGKKTATVCEDHGGRANSFYLSVHDFMRICSFYESCLPAALKWLQDSGELPGQEVTPQKPS